MRSFFATVALALVLASPAADARPRHHHRHHHFRHHAAAPAPAIAGRPAACAGIPWCGCWLRLHLGIGDARLNLARAWAAIGSAAAGPAPGVIAVWRHHVGKITEVFADGRIRLLSGNDGHAVRNRVRTTRGIIAYRHV